MCNIITGNQPPFCLAYHIAGIYYESFNFANFAIWDALEHIFGFFLIIIINSRYMVHTLSNSLVDKFSVLLIIFQLQ